MELPSASCKDGFAGSAIALALLSLILLFHTRSKNGLYGSNEAALVRPQRVFVNHPVPILIGLRRLSIKCVMAM